MSLRDIPILCALWLVGTLQGQTLFKHAAYVKERKVV